MCSSNMRPQAARAQEEGTTEMESRPSALVQVSPTSHSSNASPPTSNSVMSPGNTGFSKSQTRRQPEGSSSTNSSEASTAAWSQQAASSQTSSPQSPSTSPLLSYPEGVDLGVDPSTRATADILTRPSSLEQLWAHINIIRNELESDASRSQYLWVRQIPAALFSAAIAEHPESPKGVRITILHPEREILYRIMVGTDHDIIGRDFELWLHEALRPMGLTRANHDFWLQGSGRVPGRSREKEPDASFVPGRRPVRGSPPQWPSLVLEVGVPESLSQLRADARWWYANSQQQTKIVVLILANPKTDNTSIEIWTEVPNTNGFPTRQQNSHILECTQSARIENGAVSGDDLEINFEMLMRRPPGNNEGNLQLTRSSLLLICE